MNLWRKGRRAGLLRPDTVPSTRDQDGTTEAKGVRECGRAGMQEGVKV